MARPNKDRVMVSFYISRTGKAKVDALAEKTGWTKADTYRTLLEKGLAQNERDTARSKR